MDVTENTRRLHADRRRVPRGGRRTTDRPGKHPAVLIAESYEGVRQSCSRYLDRFHFQVVEAAHGEQAIARIAAEPPQLILTELNLPSMPAGRLKQWLSQSWRTRQIPIIVLADDLDGPAAERAPPSHGGRVDEAISARQNARRNPADAARRRRRGRQRRLFDLDQNLDLRAGFELVDELVQLRLPLLVEQELLDVLADFGQRRRPRAARFVDADDVQAASRARRRRSWCPVSG